MFVGAIRRRKICGLFFFILFSLLCNSGGATTPPEWLLEHLAGRASLSLKLDFPTFRAVPDDAGQIPYFADAIYLAPAGMPDLPEFSYEIVVNDESGAILIASHLEDSLLREVNIAPARAPQIVGRPLRPRIAGEAYKQDAYVPIERIVLSAPYYVDGSWRQTVYVHPCSYNPVRRELRVARNVQIELKGVQQQVTTVHARRVRSLFTSDENGALLIVTPAHYLSTLQPFIEWKRERGMTVEVLIYGAALAGYQHVSDTTALQQYIRTRYQKSGEPLKFALLVGNRSEVPPLRRDAPGGIKADSDQAYGQVIGNDSRNEVYIGRFSAYSEEHVKTQVERVIWYERDAHHNELSFNRGLCIASNEGTLIGDNNETDLEHTQVIRDLLLRRGYSSVALLADEKNKKVMPEEVGNVVNQGVGVITYVGHGFVNRWATSRFSSSDVLALESNRAYPVIFNTACDNGNMAAGRCFAEAWQWAQRAGKPTGAIGLNASSEAQYWDAPMRGQDAMVQYFTKERELPYVVTLGGIMNAGMNEMLRIYHDTPKSLGRITAETWNIFGDPSVLLRSKAPEILNVSHPDELLVSERSFEVHCPSNEIQATLKLILPSGEVLYENADFNGGRARFTGLRLVKDAVAHLTVWGVNKETYTADIPCIESSTASPLLIKGFRLKPKDASSTQVGIGETWEVWGTFVYRGTNPPLTDVRAHLTVTPSSSATLTGGDGVTLPTFTAPNQEEELQLGEILISDALANGDRFSLHLSLRNGEMLLAQRTMTITVVAPRAILDSVWATSKLTVHAGTVLPIGIQVTNRGQGEFSGGELRAFWGNNATAVISNLLPTIRVGKSEQVTHTVAVPSPLAPLEKAVLRIELWRGAYLHDRKELLVVGELPITPLLSYDNRYPFASKEARYQETFFYFDKPRLLEKDERLLAVQIPIHRANTTLQLDEFYIEVLRQRDLEDLPAESIVRIPIDKQRKGIFSIQNGFVTLPIEPYDYSSFENDLVLRIRCAGGFDFGEYFLPANKRPHIRTLARTEHANGKIDSIAARSLPLLRFEVAEEIPFTFIVVDPQSKPCNLAELTIFGKTYTTDASGKLTTSPLLEGNYSVSVFTGNEGLQTFSLELRRSEQEYTLQMQAPRLLDLTCVLMSTAGERIVDGQISVDGNEYYTGYNGTVPMQLREGLRQFRVYADGYEGKTFNERVTTERSRYELVLSPRGIEIPFEVQCTPNPTQGNLVVSSPRIMSTLRIFSVDGALVADYRIHGYSYAVNLQHLPRGLYIIEVYGAEPEQLARIRIVKDR